MTRDEDRLRGLLGHAVDDVEPDRRIEEIRRATQSDSPTRKVTVMPTAPRRSWLYGAIGAAAAVAAVVGLAVVVTRGGDEPGPVAGSTDSAAATTSPTTTPTSTPTGSDSPSSSDTASSTDTAGAAIAVYYVGDGPRGPVLFREFHRGDPADAVAEATSAPRDPDYRTDWAAGDVVSSARSGSVITVGMASDDLATRPADLSAAEATVAVQSLVYTAQAAYQTRTPVQFEVDGTPMTTLYGVRLDGPVKAASVYEVLSLMSITAPEEGQEVSGTLRASGANNGFEATVAWQIKQGDKVVKRGSTMASGSMEEKLFPWQVSIPLDGLAAGTYTFVAMNDDPTGSEGDGKGPDTDTRTFVIR